MGRISARRPRGGARSGGVIAEYKGRKINLAKDDLADIAVCAEYPDKSVKCFDSETESVADIAAYNERHKAGTKDALPATPKDRGTLSPRAGEATILVDGDGTPSAFLWDTEETGMYSG